MKSIKIEKFGGPETLEVKDIEIGKPGPKEVLIKNLSIGLNYIDVYHRTGLYPIPLPSGIGLEACGIIEELLTRSIALAPGPTGRLIRFLIFSIP